jgi:hypothetical protein
LTEVNGIQFSVVTATEGSTQKRIIPDKDGKPVKDAEHDLGIYRGQVQTVTVDGPAGFAAVLAGLGANQAITLGVTDAANPQRLVTAKKLEGMKTRPANTVARTLEFFGWATDGYTPTLLDHDPEPGHQPITDQELWERFVRVMPEFAGAARVVTVSTSSSLYHKETGECLKPASGHHTYIFVRGDVDRFKAIFQARAWLMGEAFCKLGSVNRATGTQGVLKRYLIDTAVFSPERLVYEAGALIPEDAPFVQRRPVPVAYDGEGVDLDEIPDLTPDQGELAARLEDDAYRKAKGLALVATEQRIIEADPTLPKAKARAIAQQRIESCERGTLAPDHILYLQHGGSIKAGEITPQHHGLKLRDPQEPDYRNGEYCGKIYCDAPGQWVIVSFAHGGQKYRPAPVAPAIIHDDTEQVELAQDSERIQQRLLDTLQRQLAKLRVHDRVAASYRLAPERPTHPDEGGDVQQFNTQEDAYRTALDEGARLIVNLTGTGGNKTGFVARSFPHNWGVERIIAITPDVLNAEMFNPEFANWEILPGPNYGVVLDEDGKRRRANIDTPDHLKIEPGNCSRAYASQIIVSKNAANTGLICGTCVFNQSQLCSNGTDEKGRFGAKNQQHAAWEAKRILTSYGRLTGIGLGDESENLAKAGLFLDESSGNVETTKALDIDDKALDQTIAAIAMEAPDLLAPLNPLLGWLREKQYQNHPRYDKRYGMPLARCLDEVRGLIPDNLNWEALNQLEDGHHERVLFGLDKVKLTDQEKRRLANLSKKREATKAKLKRIAELEAKAAAADGHIFRNAKGIKGTRKALGFDGLTPDERRELRDLKRSILTDTEAAELADLQARYEASKTEALDANQAAAAAKAVRMRWLCDFIAIVLGDAPGNIRFMPDGIVATIQQTAHLDAIHSAKFTVLTDASERRTKAALAQKYGFAEHEIFIFEISQPKHQNSQLIQVTGLGTMGRNRGIGLEECKVNLVAKFKELDRTHRHFDHKDFYHEARLWVDSVGSNDFKDCTSISATPPRPSINGLLDEYCVLNKTIVDSDDEGFKAFYSERYAEAIRQWQGRTRANLKPGVAHTHYIITDEVLPITPDRIIPAWEICPEAARKGQRTILALVEVAQSIVATGAKLTQAALAAASAVAGLNHGKGYCQSHICGLWVDIKNGLSLFLRGSYKKSDISPERLKALQDKASILAMAFDDGVVTSAGVAVTMAGALSWEERAAELVTILADLMDGPPEDDLPWLLELLPEGQNGSILGLLAAIFLPDWAPIGGVAHA